ncbi:hypothetical protein TWF569_004286 [Orbilia oligospora]|uniref:RWD domain-containing protein n=1 Tax=Orbilia oligospora TaxID=2813651 RepID=A0A7C8JF88_ORBOL|nr:hypothetical protein TWF102_003286 [Orbilia oligospora]KAF3078669.1 hypothetical protein TWF103_005316 [Orbilia oligospora]KAF3080996.1 hypothetical protein TWF706_002402 [Orbilia oligospora]KAF3119216.1 hypothetical protein TWF569_004286 [Orbilia oligospora]KAF3119850.1 hypothetical protein TWF703_002992 [Orbilia oligospora]
MSASEEQEQELEVLESIYPDELTKISDKEFSIRLSLEEPDVDVDAEGYEAPIVFLRVTYTPDYPNAAPDLSISLDSPSTHPLTFPGDEAPLVSALDTAVEENMGMAMVFTLATTLKEAAESILRDRADEARRIRDEVARIEEEKEMEKFRGELVTKEVFENWRLAFIKEMKEKKEQEEREREEAEAKGRRSGNVSGVGPAGKKLTGRELFERGLVGGMDEDDEDDAPEETPDVGKLEIKA